MKIINKVTDESYIQWIEKFLEKVDQASKYPMSGNYG